MKVFSVFGIKQSGKTTTIENIIRELRKRGYSVGSVKEINNHEFAMDKDGTNTDRHKKAGAQLVTARGCSETDILFQAKLTIEDILKFYDHDFVVLEGVKDSNVPCILTAHTPEEIDEGANNMVFAVSGVVSNNIKEHKGLPVINSNDEIGRLVDLIEEKVYDKLPDFSPNCCTSCGFNCRELGARILKGQAKRDDCVISKSGIKLYIDGKQISMVPFVQNILCNTVEGVVKELQGYRPGARIEIKIGD